MEFFRQDYWNGLPFPSAGDLPNPGIKTKSPALQADSLPSEPPWKHLVLIIIPLNRQNYFLHFINEKTSLRDAAKLASGHFANKFQSGRAGIQNWDWIHILTPILFIPSWELNPGVLHCRQVLYHLNHQGSPI